METIGGSRLRADRGRRSRHAVADVLGGHVDVAVQVERDDDDRVAGAEIDRSSSMPSTVLTASSIRWVTSASTLFGRRPGQGRAHGDRGQIDRGEAIDAQLK